MLQTSLLEVSASFITINIKSTRGALIRGLTEEVTVVKFNNNIYLMIMFAAYSLFVFPR